MSFVSFVTKYRYHHSLLLAKPENLFYHSKKDSFDSPLCEALKDADVLARFLENPEKEITGMKRQRLLNACADIQSH